MFLSLKKSKRCIGSFTKYTQGKKNLTERFQDLLQKHYPEGESEAFIANDMFSIFDADGDGTIDHNELVMSCSTKAPSETSCWWCSVYLMKTGEMGSLQRNIYKGNNTAN